MLKVLRGLGKPPSFDGNDAEYQDFRFRFRIHMSLVSAVSQQLMVRCEVERNPLALITTGSVRTLVRSVGAEAWRLVHSRYAPDTQNRQYALVQKIMVPAKLWCDHAEGFESGLRAWELDVGEWKTCIRNCVGRCSQVHGDDEYGTGCPQEQFTVGNVFQQCRSSNSFVVMVLFFPKLWSKRKTSCTDINTCKKCGKRNTETRWRSIRQQQQVTTATQTKGTTRKAKANANKWTLWKRISLLKQPQPCRILHKHRVRSELSRAIQTLVRKVGSWV